MISYKEVYWLTLTVPQKKTLCVLEKEGKKGKEAGVWRNMLLPVLCCRSFWGLKWRQQWVSPNSINPPTWSHPCTLLLPQLSTHAWFGASLLSFLLPRLWPRNPHPDSRKGPILSPPGIGPTTCPLQNSCGNLPLAAQLGITKRTSSSRSAVRNRMPATL